MYCVTGVPEKIRAPYHAIFQVGHIDENGNSQRMTLHLALREFQYSACCTSTAAQVGGLQDEGYATIWEIRILVAYRL